MGIEPPRLARARKPLAFLALALLAGCISPFAPSEERNDQATSGERVSFFHSAMTLAPEKEENSSALRTGSFFAAWAEGDDYPTWFADPLRGDALVTKVDVKLFVRVTGPVVESARFPDIMVYAGSGDAWMGYGERRDISNFQPGQLYEIDIEVTLPEPGMWIPAAEGFGLKVVPVMLQQDERADVEILLGGDDASEVTWTVEPLDLPAARAVPGSATGEVVGTIYAPVPPPTTSKSTPLPVPEGATYIIAWMNTTENIGIPDIDLSIVAPNGETIATSGTPTPQEAIRIAGPNLRGPGDYSLVVTTAGSPRAEFALEWLVGEPN